MAAVTVPAAGAAVSWVPAVRDALRRHQLRRTGRGYTLLRWAGAAVFGALLVGLVVTVVQQSAPAFAHSGVGFLWSGTWNPGAGDYGAGLLLVGTLVTTFVALLLAAPVGLCAAAFLADMAPRWLGRPVATAIQLLAGVPSIVVGLWGLLVLSPIFASTVEPGLAGVPLIGRLFHGPAYGPSILLASVVLAVMILPTIVALSHAALSAVPRAEREGAIALGATRTQVLRSVVFPAARPGIQAALTLGVGRALGESIAVALVIGNLPSIPHSLGAPGATLASAIVNQFAEASPGLGTSSVIALGAVLLILTVAVNAGGQALSRRRAGYRDLAVAA